MCGVAFPALKPAICASTAFFEGMPARRYQFAFDMVGDAAEGFVLHVRGQLDGDSHDFDLVDG